MFSSDVGLLQGATIAVTGGGSLSLARLALPVGFLRTSGVGSRLTFKTVTMPSIPDLGVQMMARHNGYSVSPPDLHSMFWLMLWFPTTFTVISGPCTVVVVDGHMCVGRPAGYLADDEDCDISVAGAGGQLGMCPVFDIDGAADGDYLDLPRSAGRMDRRIGADCPGVDSVPPTLMPGQKVTWHSDSTVCRKARMVSAAVGNCALREEAVARRKRTSPLCGQEKYIWRNTHPTNHNLVSSYRGFNSQSS